MVLVIDDIDTFVSGPRSKHPELCEFILFLRNEIKFLKVVVALTNFNSVATLARDFRFSRNCVLELRCWSSGSEFQQFVVYVARACNIERRQDRGGFLDISPLLYMWCYRICNTDNESFGNEGLDQRSSCNSQAYFTPLEILNVEYS